MFGTLCPPRRDRPLNLELPIVKSPPDIVAAIGAKLAAVAAGDITPGEGTAIARLFDTKRKVIENEKITRKSTKKAAPGGTEAELEFFFFVAM